MNEFHNKSINTFMTKIPESEHTLVLYQKCFGSERDIFACSSTFIIGAIALFAFVMNLIIYKKLSVETITGRIYLPIYIICSLQCLVIMTQALVIELYEQNTILYQCVSQFIFYFLLAFMLLDISVHLQTRRLKIVLYLSILFFQFSVGWRIYCFIEHSCGNIYYFEYLLNLVINFIFLIVQWIFGNRQLKNLCSDDNLSGGCISDSSIRCGYSLYKWDDSFVQSLKKDIKAFILTMSFLTMVFFIAMGLWHFNFLSFYVCLGEDIYISKNLTGQIIDIIKKLTIIGYSLVINWCFYFSKKFNRFENKGKIDINIPKSCQDTGDNDNNFIRIDSGTYIHCESVHVFLNPNFFSYYYVLLNTQLATIK